MSMPAVPATPAVGGPDHTLDHGTIEVILAGLQGAVAALQGAQPAVLLAGNNTVTLPGTGTGMLSVTVSAVNRDGGADLFDVYYGSAKIFSLNSYGELRLSPAALGHVAQVISVLAGQGADAWQVLSPGAQVLARVGPDGSASFAGPVSRYVAGAPAGWVHCTMMSDWTAYQGRNLAVKLCPDNMVQISGQIQPGLTGNSTAVATLPAGYAPASRPEVVLIGQYNAITSWQSSGTYLEAEPGGTLTLYSFGTYYNYGNAHIVVGGRYPLDAN